MVAMWLMIEPVLVPVDVVGARNIVICVVPVSRLYIAESDVLLGCTQQRTVYVVDAVNSNAPDVSCPAVRVVTVADCCNNPNGIGIDDPAIGISNHPRAAERAEQMQLRARRLIRCSVCDGIRAQRLRTQRGITPDG